MEQKWWARLREGAERAEESPVIGNNIPSAGWELWVTHAPEPARHQSFWNFYNCRPLQQALRIGLRKGWSEVPLLAHGSSWWTRAEIGTRCARSPMREALITKRKAGQAAQLPERHCHMTLMRRPLEGQGSTPWRMGLAAGGGSNEGIFSNRNELLWLSIIQARCLQWAA